MDYGALLSLAVFVFYPLHSAFVSGFDYIGAGFGAVFVFFLRRKSGFAFVYHLIVNRKVSCFCNIGQNQDP